LLKRIVSEVMLTLLLIGMVSLAFNIKPIRSSHSTIIYLDPSSYIFDANKVSVGYRFNVTVKVSDVENLLAWQVCILYDESLINVSRVFEPVWDPEYVFYENLALFAYAYAPWGLGNGSFACMSVSLEEETFSGSGKLVIIEFEILAIPSVGETYSSILNINNDFTYLLDPYGNDILAVKQDGYYEISGGAGPVLNATVDVNPHALNLRSRGRWITTYIELPEDYDVSDINVSTILLNDSIPAEVHPVGIGDYDDDGVPDLMVKFDRAELTSYILTNVDITKLFEEWFMTITLTITGELYDGTQFQGSTTIKILMPILRGIGRHIFLL